MRTAVACHGSPVLIQHLFGNSPSSREVARSVECRLHNTRGSTTRSSATPNKAEITLFWKPFLKAPAVLRTGSQRFPPHMHMRWEEEEEEETQQPMQKLFRRMPARICLNQCKAKEMVLQRANVPDAGLKWCLIDCMKLPTLRCCQTPRSVAHAIPCN